MSKLLLSFFLFSSCGYHLAQNTNPTITVPYIKGDIDGRLTTALAYSISAETPLQYQVSSGRYQLIGEILTSSYEKTGFQYDRDETTGKRINRLNQIEERKTVELRVELIDTLTGTTLLGPEVVTSSTDYDFVDSDSIQDLSLTSQTGRPISVLQFSMGQLGAFEDARGEASHPIYRKLAKRISSAILIQNAEMN
ncbi:MAG: hypothetical protein SNF33_04650 [Candidatus Algichlamydia australiensis]|nr:hypothetical protein [Chlamydiales bacterium]